MIARRRAREVALQVLYALDANPGLDPEGALAVHFDRFDPLDEDEPERPGDPAERPFAESLVRGVLERKDDVDALIGQVSRNWRLERMALVDRNVLRLAMFELKYRDDIPARVSINEAVELAKRFGAAEAPAFVNGLLDSALRAFDIRK